ncbi:MAG: hypothetical protein IPO17_10430 [Flavobacteriales bacterium]|nr:hypothetical protein [Flavobacteriales bacterium]
MGQSLESALDESIPLLAAWTRSEPPKSATGGKVEHEGHVYTYAGIDWSSPGDVAMIKEWTRERLAKLTDVLKSAVCVKINYCEMVKRHGHSMTLAGLILTAIAPFIPEIATGLGIAGLVVYLVKDRYFDRLCNCPVTNK